MALLLMGCTATKKLFQKKSKVDTTTTSVEKGTVTSTRPGDTLTVMVPHTILKDTTIYRRGKTTTIVQRYDKDGQLYVDCISDEINELKNYVKNALEVKAEETEVNTKDVTTGWQPIFILYGFIGLAFLMFINKLINKFV